MKPSLVHKRVRTSSRVSNSDNIAVGIDAAKSLNESMGVALTSTSAVTYEEAMLNSESCLTCHSTDKVEPLHMAK